MSQVERDEKRKAATLAEIDALAAKLIELRAEVAAATNNPLHGFAEVIGHLTTNVVEMTSTLKES